ncbi:MAG: outer membrane lipoprotein chaperone LolA [Motiliproteus sp.]
MRSWILALILSAVANTALAGTAAENLNRLLAGVQSLSADFEQLVMDNSGSRLQSSHGHVDLQRPGRFRWETAEPFPQLLVSDGQQLWLFDKDLEQVTQQVVDNRLSNTPALLLSGDLQQLQDSFQVSGPKEGNEGIYRLTPMAEEAIFEVMRIMFVDGVPTEMQLQDSLGQQTSVVFSNLKLNSSLQQSLFTFEIPEGVDVLVE